MNTAAVWANVPLIKHNPRGGKKMEFCPAQALGYNERTVAEYSNARLKDEPGPRHLMFGMQALSADQLMRLRQ